MYYDCWGALIPPAYGLIADSVGFKWAFILVLACYGYILYYGYYKRKNKGELQSA